MIIKNKLLIFNTLMSNPTFVHMSGEESIVGNALIKEEWLKSQPEEKQLARIQFLTSGKKRKSVINLEYYEKMIYIYDIIIKNLSKLQEKFDNIEKQGNVIDLPLLRFAALLLIEQGFIDEQIVPSHHIRPKFFQNISKEFNSDYPDLNLKEFAEKYTEMFESWPEKSKYDIKKS